MRRLHARSSSSRGVSVDVEGATLGPDCILVRRTPQGYRCVSQNEAAALQALVIDREDDPNWLFRQCHRIVKALTDQNLALAQIYGLSIPIVGLNREQLQKLASIARFTKANFNSDHLAVTTVGGRQRANLNPTTRIRPRGNRPPRHCRSGTGSAQINAITSWKDLFHTSGAISIPLHFTVVTTSV